MSRRAAGAFGAPRLWEGALVGALLGLAALAWVATGRLADPHMRLGLLTGAGSTPESAGGGTVSPAAMGLFLATWAVMMVAMMFPAVVPVVVTVDRWSARTHRSRSVTALFVAGYLLVWATSGAVVYAAVIGVVPLLPSGESAVRVGAAILVMAGAYQFTPLKDACLRQCRSPLAFVAQHVTQLRQGGLAGAKVGVVHGLFCLGCCWTLMIVLVLLGMMSLAWMAVIAGVIFLEKVLPHGQAVRSTVGLVLVGTGIALLFSARVLPAVLA